MLRSRGGDGGYWMARGWRYTKILLFFLTFSVLVATPKKSTLHGGQSRSSWSAEQGKENYNNTVQLD